MYGKIIDGGKQMSKGLTKGINDKLDGFKGENERRSLVANAVLDAYKVNTVSTQHTDNIRNSGKFTKPSVPKNV
jgi:hypothetical protein